MVDIFSGYPWFQRLRSLSTSAITSILDDWFYKFGRPLVVCSDGGPQFRQEFVDYCVGLGITMERSSPYRPQSNGLAEAAVKSVKKLILKTANSGEDIRKAFVSWRDMPRADGISPAVAFFLSLIHI